MLHGPIDLLRRHLPFFHQAVGKNHGDIPVKEVEHSIIHSLKFNPKLVNAVPQVICLGPPEFITQLLQPLDFDTAFVANFLRETVKPL